MMVMSQLDAGVRTSEPGRSQAAPSNIHGVLVVDKPEGLSSFQTTRRVARMLSLSKAGHCGTLDPFATGVLVLAVNQGTRVVDQLTLQDKVYVVTVRFGVETDTLDRTGQVQSSYDGPPIGAQACENAMGRFSGSFEQEVPRCSAVPVGGRRLYDLARRGIEVTPPRRVVHIESMELLAYEWPLATLRVRCGKGTYIRQLAADIGREMGCGAHVHSLRRTASGPFTEEMALSMDRIEELKMKEEWARKVVPLAEALAHLPRVCLKDEGLLRRLGNGDLDRAWQKEQMCWIPEGRSPVCVLTPRMQLAALWWPDAAEGAERRLRVFPFHWNG
jgi:tRNA pseudouridine55 synthase